MVLLLLLLYNGGACLGLWSIGVVGGGIVYRFHH